MAKVLEVCEFRSGFADHRKALVCADAESAVRAVRDTLKRRHGCTFWVSESLS